MPTTLVGQVDAAIGGKTAIDLPEGKNLVGAFHWPVRTVIDPALLETLPEAERRDGHGRGRQDGPARRRAALGAARAASSSGAAPRSRRPSACATRTTQGERAVLNLGHTFAHALEAAGRLRARHGEAVALGLLAALRLSGPGRRARSTRCSRRSRCASTATRAWAALARDKKARGGSLRLVLLEALGKPRSGVELPEQRRARALDELIAD